MKAADPHASKAASMKETGWSRATGFLFKDWLAGDRQRSDTSFTIVDDVADSRTWRR